MNAWGTFPRAIHDPRELPELRQTFLNTTLPSGPWEQWEIQGNIMSMAGNKGYSPDDLPSYLESLIELGRSNARWYHHSFEEAQLIYVTPELTDVIDSARDSVPSDHVLSLMDIPTPAGLVVFARPLEGTEAMVTTLGNGLHEWELDPERRHRKLLVHAVLWAPVMLPARDRVFVFDRDEDFINPAVSIASFRLLVPEDTDDTAERLFGQMKDRQVFWLPLGRSDWIHGDRLDTRINDAIDTESDQWISMMEDRKLMMSLWSIVQQKRLTESVAVGAPRHVRRRMERDHGVTEVAPVQVIHLRRPEYRPILAEEDPTHTGRHLTKRFMVRPHFRNQAYGPRRELRRLILVPPHWKGPVDGPITHTERIWSVDR